MNITSKENSKVKYWVSLHNKKNRDEEKKFLIEDEHLIDEAFKNNVVLETIGIDSDNDYVVTKEIMQKISKQETSAKKIAVCKFIEEQKITGNVLILDKVQDPGNLGTIIRSAVAFNFKNIVLSLDSVDLYNEKVLRASEGYIFGVNVIRTDIKEFINEIKNEYMILCSDVNNGQDIANFKHEKIALILGNEGSGVSDEIKSLSHHLVNIKTNNNVESLNVGVAASILMYGVYHE